MRVVRLVVRVTRSERGSKGCMSSTRREPENGVGLIWKHRPSCAWRTKPCGTRKADDQTLNLKRPVNQSDRRQRDWWGHCPRSVID